jgi:eukaryotic-like serine/threonine-protein kinase
VLVDFGVALRFGASRLTRAGNVMGTMAYLPPEVLEGADPEPASSDQYALGMLLSESLTGKAAFRSAGEGGRQRFGTLVTEKEHALDPGTGFPDKLRAVVRRATSPEPGERYPNRAELARELEALIPPGRRAELDRRLGRPVPRFSRRVLFGLALVALGALLGAFVLGSLFIVLLVVVYAGT